MSKPHVHLIGSDQDLKRLVQTIGRKYFYSKVYLEPHNPMGTQFLIINSTGTLIENFIIRLVKNRWCFESVTFDEKPIKKGYER